MVLVCYDVSIVSNNGSKRLRKVAKELKNHGQRVQNSVFELNLDWSTFLKVKNNLNKIIDDKVDSLRFYYLGNKWNGKIEHIGAKTTYNTEGILLI